MSENNEWELSSGLDLDGADVEVTKCEFGFNAKIAAGRLFANMTLTDMESGEDYDQSFSVGDGWDTNRDGSELVSERPKKINKNTNYGILIASAIELIGAENVPEVLGGTPKEADIWIGTRWTMGTVKMSRVNPTTGAAVEKDVFVFTDFLGTADDEPQDAPAEEPAKPAKAAAKKATTARKATAKKGNAIPEGIDADMWAQLVEVARGVDDHDAFMEAAFEIEGVEDDAALAKAVMGTKAGSVWAARG